MKFNNETKKMLLDLYNTKKVMLEGNILKLIDDDEKDSKKIEDNDIRDFISDIEKGIVDVAKGEKTVVELGTLIADKLGNIAVGFESMFPAFSAK